MKGTSDIIIRDFRMNDYDAMIELWKDTQLSYRPKGRDSRENIESQIKQPNTIYLIVEIEGKIVGSILGSHDGRKGWINRLAVSPLFQKQGIARKLVNEVERWLSAAGIDIIACQIEDWNKISMEFFSKIGYEKHTDIIYFSRRKSPDV